MEMCYIGYRSLLMAISIVNFSEIRKKFGPFFSTIAKVLWFVNFFPRQQRLLDCSELVFYSVGSFKYYSIIFFASFCQKTSKDKWHFYSDFIHTLVWILQTMLARYLPTLFLKILIMYRNMHFVNYCPKNLDTTYVCRPRLSLLLKKLCCTFLVKSKALQLFTLDFL